jgi:hypothetical protein
MTVTPFDELQQIARESGVEKSLDFLEHQFRRDKEYFKLFEVLKMRCRQRMGLPLTYSQQPDELNEAQQRQLEDGLLDACREVGTLFFKAGKLQEGWMYLQPVGDKVLADKLIRSLEPDEDNLDTLIEIAVSQGAAPVFGFGMLLQHYGTCNGITTFDTQAGRFDSEIRRQLASELLRHIYNELMENVGFAIEQNGGNVDPGASLGELIKTHPDLTANGAHHIDTTHLASVMRIARLVKEPGDIQLASDLADYGSQLDKDFQYPGSPPFEDTYRDHQFFYRGLLGQDVDAAVKHFEDKASTIDVDQYGPVAEETLVDFLVRVGRIDQALEVVTQKLIGKHEPMGIAPNVFEIAKTPNQLTQLMEYYQSENDLLGYAVSLLKHQQANPHSS